MHSSVQNSPPQPRAAAGTLQCPRCGGKLIDPELMALCPQCGWCRALEEATSLTAAPVSAGQRRSMLGSAELWDLIWASPAWLLILISGSIAILLLTGMIARQLPVGGLIRAAWSTGQIGLGLLMILVAQAWSLILLAPQDDKLGTKDLLLSGRLWGLTLRRLPETQWQLDLAVWGMTLAVTAVSLVGGLGYWLPVPR